MGCGDKLSGIEDCTGFFKSYYGLVFDDVDGVDAEEVFECLETPLPITFRVNKSVDGAEQVTRYLEQCSNEVLRLEWCDAWQLKFGNVIEMKIAFRDSELGGWRQWLASKASRGLVERQEAVSMLPPTLLDIKPGHAVLDMCASPGSKTAQALDALHVGRQASDRGFVVANELDMKRAHILVRRLRSIGKTANKSVAVINHKAQTIPDSDQRFDRVICDVPCSGDGTLRKNKGLWAHWVPHYGLQLHTTQLQIAMRAVHLLKVGGVMAYSTCSLNPVENEAVVGALLDAFRDEVEVVDCGTRLRESNFTHREGITEWKVVDDTGMVFRSFKQARTRSKPKSCRNRFRPTMFPRVGGTEMLRRCIRVCPNDNDTGGFFVAIIRKVAEIEPRVFSGTKRKYVCVSQNKPCENITRKLKKWYRSAENVRLVAAGFDETA